MFGLFGKKYSNPALLEELRTRQDRWFVFLDKLETRMDELTTAAVPELHTVYQQDDDPYKRSHGQMLMGLIGQVNHMREKANEVREDNIVSFLYGAEATVPVITSEAGRDYHNRILAFRMACINRYYIFDEKVNEAIVLLKGTEGQQDLEGAYREQLAAFERIRDKFSCKQCGGNITIPKMFFIDTYVTCSFCHSQNTFKPSTAARMVMHNARALAEQRTAQLLRAYEESNPQDRSLYAIYLRAMFNEWNSIVPDMAVENEKFYQRLLEEHTINHFK
ncbi:hypothetical protein [Chitinophaga arvensicola]|uniref:Uncharacterized protein n=1 Tax=Chitinophaga arvensicola TaxID=29529 RepID=A0A1I0RTR2_9BACT|nr:hypothetical protein [Chitinophaga arvensicola]SEW44799.1 hypothetical protein SAMN04488122_3378 [Chitinophaga arvensicola]